MASLKHKLITAIAPLYYYGRYRRLCRELQACLSVPRELVCFFPAYHTGGAEKVHLQIPEAVADRNVATIIAHKSRNDVWKSGFEKASRCLVDLHAVGNHAFFRKRLARKIASLLNEWSAPANLFGCSNELFYDVADLLQNPALRLVDLLHAFAPYQVGIEQRSVHSAARLDSRIVINQKTKSDYAVQYRQFAVPEGLLQRVQIIPNGFFKGCPEFPKDFSTPFRCLFVGRHSPEKRLDLFLKIAEQARDRNLPIAFSVVGADPYADAPGNVQFLGEITDEKALDAIYDRHHFLLTTSVFEGFPLTIMEGMCRGLVNISTAVGGIPEHIHDGENGFLLNYDSRTEQMADAFCRRLQSLIGEPGKLAQVSARSRYYVQTTFSPQRFVAAYRRLLIGQ